MLFYPNIFRKENEVQGVDFGELTIPKTYRSLWIIDGQHRLYGYSGVKGPLSPKDVLQVAAIENVGIGSPIKEFKEGISKNFA